MLKYGTSLTLVVFVIVALLLLLLCCSLVARQSGYTLKYFQASVQNRTKRSGSAEYESLAQQNSPQFSDSDSNNHRTQTLGNTQIIVPRNISRSFVNVNRDGTKNVFRNKTNLRKRDDVSVIYQSDLQVTKPQLVMGTNVKNESSLNISSTVFFNQTKIGGSILPKHENTENSKLVGSLNILQTNINLDSKQPLNENTINASNSQSITSIQNVNNSLEVNKHSHYNGNVVKDNRMVNIELQSKLYLNSLPHSIQSYQPQNRFPIEHLPANILNFQAPTAKKQVSPLNPQKLYNNRDEPMNKIEDENITNKIGLTLTAEQQLHSSIGSHEFGNNSGQMQTNIQVPVQSHDLNSELVYPNNPTLKLEEIKDSTRIENKSFDIVTRNSYTESDVSDLRNSSFVKNMKDSNNITGSIVDQFIPNESLIQSTIQRDAKEFHSRKFASISATPSSESGSVDNYSTHISQHPTAPVATDISQLQMVHSPSSTAHSFTGTTSAVSFEILQPKSDEEIYHPRNLNLLNRLLRPPAAPKSLMINDTHVGSSELHVALNGSTRKEGNSVELESNGINLTIATDGDKNKIESQSNVIKYSDGNSSEMSVQLGNKSIPFEIETTNNASTMNNLTDYSTPIIADSIISDSHLSYTVSATNTNPTPYDLQGLLSQPKENNEGANNKAINNEINNLDVNNLNNRQYLGQFVDPSNQNGYQFLPYELQDSRYYHTQNILQQQGIQMRYDSDRSSHPQPLQQGQFQQVNGGLVFPPTHTTPHQPIYPYQYQRRLVPPKVQQFNGNNYYGNDPRILGHYQAMGQINGYPPINIMMQQAGRTGEGTTWQYNAVPGTTDVPIVQNPVLTPNQYPMPGHSYRIY